MYNVVNITDNVYWVGTNDRTTDRFENMWPLERGVAYNSYVIVDEKTVLIDTVEFGESEIFLDKVTQVLGDRDLDYLIINHMEPDHSGAVKDVIVRYPNVKIVGNAKTFPMVEGFFGITDNFYEVKEGDKIELGKHTLQFFMTPMVHWPETMVTYEIANKILFSGDAFGSFGALDGGIFDDELKIEFYEDEMRRYYSNIVGKYGATVQAALKKLAGLEIKYICSTHGPIWRSHLDKVLTHYDNWSKLVPEEEGIVIVYGTMYGNTAKTANVIARRLALEGIKNVRVYDASKTHQSYILSDIWKFKGLIIGSASYNTAVYPPIEALLSKLELYGLKNRYLGMFGTYSWNGGGLRGIAAFAEKMRGIEVVGEGFEAFCAPKENDLKKAEAMAVEMANKLKAER